jgi:hypothetical protein
MVTLVTGCGDWSVNRGDGVAWAWTMPYSCDSGDLYLKTGPGVADADATLHLTGVVTGTGASTVITYTATAAQMDLPAGTYLLVVRWIPTGGSRRSSRGLLVVVDT